MREPRTAEEEETFYRATAQVFSDPDDKDAAARWRHEAEEPRQFHPVHLRAAFRGETFVGSDVIYERQLRLGSHGEAKLTTACIGVVLSHPDHRMQGVGRALMQDAIAFARERRFALLLLAGIPNFYHRFGYVDVADGASWSVERKHVDAPGEPGDAIMVRPATEDDASALLALYERHHGDRPGGFVRSLGEQRSRLRTSADGQYQLALDARGEPCGYLKFRGAARARAQEVAADTWEAAAALLRRQELLLRGAPPPEPKMGPGGVPEPPPPEPTSLTWSAPPGSRTHLLLADRVPLVGEQRSRPRAGWLARPAHLPTLFRGMQPALAACWRAAGLAWSGTLALHVAADKATDQPADECLLDLSSSRVRVRFASDGPSPDATVRLLPGAFTQLLFGFRPLWWIVEQPGNRVPAAVRPVLQALFPPEPASIPATDGF